MRRALLCLAAAAGVSCTGLVHEPAAPIVEAPEGSGGPPVDPGETPAPGVEVDRVELRAAVSVLAVGQRLALSATAYDAAGARLDGVALTFESDAPEIAAVDGAGEVSALAEGEATLTARAGDVRSPPLALRVLPPRTRGPASVRLALPADAPVALAVGAQVSLEAAVRDDAGHPVADAELIFESAAPDVATVDGHGLVEAIAPGRASIVARYLDATSPPLEVSVVAGETYLAVTLEAPNADVAAARAVHVSARLQRLEVGSPSRIGVPVQADRAALLVDDAEIGPLDVRFGEVEGTVGLDGVAPGEHTLRVLAEVGGEVVRSAPRRLRVFAPDDATFTDVGEVAAQQASLTEVQGTLHLATSTCRRFCVSEAFTAGPDGFAPLDYRMQWWRDWDGDRSRDERSISGFNLERFVGWGWVGVTVRAAHVARGARLVTWSNEESRNNFNQEDMPERYWFDCHVAEWDPAGGLDGAGGWRLLTEDDPTFLWDRPRTEDLVAQWGAREDARFPRGTDTDRRRDCDHPKVARLPSGAPVVAQLTSAVPGPDWQLELRRWADGAWVEHAPPHSVLGSNPALGAIEVDPSGGVQVVLHEAAGSSVLELVDGAWRVRGGDDTPETAAAARTEAGTLAVSVAGGDARAYLGSSDGWTPLGDLLDADPWAEVHEAAVASAGGALFVAWTEGPAMGNRDLYVATWRADEARWVRLGAGPAERDPDQTVFDPELVVRADGHLAVRYATPTDDPEAPTAQRVRVTAARMLP